MTAENLISIQRKFEAYVPRQPTNSELSMAILTELGELAQEIKGGMEGGLPGWAWWKRVDKTWTPKPKSVVLEELADVIHFALMKEIKTIDRVKEMGHAEWPKTLSRRYTDCWNDAEYPREQVYSTYVYNSSDLISPYGGLIDVVHIARALGVTKEEFEDAYINKAKINFTRYGLTEEQAQEVIDAAN